MNVKQRVLIVEDHTLLRAGLCTLLSQDPQLMVVGEAGNGREAIRLVAKLSPQLVLMDLMMPGTNGIEATEEIRRRQFNVRVLVLSMHKAEAYIHASLAAGANGYILKDAAYDELRIAIHYVLNGKTYISPDIGAHVVAGCLGGGTNASDTSGWEKATHRERQVLKLVAEGQSNTHIADYLSLSVKTVEKHRSNLMKKFGLHNVAMMTAFAIERGLIEGECSVKGPCPRLLN